MRKLLNMLGRNRSGLESDLEKELRYHIDRRVHDYMDHGFSEAEARRRAALELGGVAQAQEHVRDTWTWRWLQNCARDVRYAVRTLTRARGFTLVAVLSLALGIGANTAIFSIFHALVLRSLPVSEPDRLVVVTRTQLSQPYPLFRHLKDQSKSLQGVLAFRTQSARVTFGDSTERITAALVSGSYFDVLGVRLQLGTPITEEDDRIPGTGGWRGPVAVLSDGLWTRRFGSERSIIGSPIVVNDQQSVVRHFPDGPGERRNSRRGVGRHGAGGRMDSGSPRGEVGPDDGAAR